MRLEEFVLKISAIDDAGELVETVAQVLRERFGVKLLNFGIYGQLTRYQRFTDRPTGIFSEMSEAWAERYLEQDHMSTDAAFHHLQYGTVARVWTDFGDDLVMKEAGEFGLTHGLAVPLIGSGAVKAGLMIGGGEQLEEPDVRPLLEAMALLFHARFDQIGKALGDAPLTEIQLEILRWLGQGKSKGDIATITNLTVHNVDYHIRQIKLKLNATSALGAVLQGMMLGLIHPEFDALETTQVRSR